MAGTTKDMSKIRQFLIRKRQGLSNRKASEGLMNKETANRYARLAAADPLGLDGLLALDDPVLEFHFNKGNPAYCDERFEHFKSQFEYFKREMRDPHVTLKLLWEEYRRGHELDGTRYELTQFRYHYNQLVGAEKDPAPSTVLKDLFVPGQKLFIDFAGDTAEYIDVETGEAVTMQVFVACLPFSDYGFISCVHSQKIEDFLSALSECFKALGGVPKVLVPDNLKSAVTKSDRYQPGINRMLEDFANHHGCAVIPARPAHPRDKSNAEACVKHSYREIYAPLRHAVFYSEAELNEAFRQQMHLHNQKRLTDVPYSREEQFLALERRELMPLPAGEYEIKSYTELKVMHNGCIKLGRDMHYYSVPYQYIGQQVKVIYTPTLVKVYSAADGTEIACHLRNYKPGGYTTLDVHMASSSLAYRQRSAEGYIERAARVSEPLAEVIRTIFLQGGRQPEEIFYNGCDGLLHLQRCTDPQLFNKACNAAIQMNQCHYSFISNLIRTRCSGLRMTQMEIEFNPPEHENIRGRDQFE